MRKALAGLMMVGCLWAITAPARINVVTLPGRDSVQLTIYNSEDITMVREHRLLTVKPGINRIQFTWANTLIDPTSIDFRILDHVDKVDLVDTTFPAGRNDALQWNIRSQMAGKIPVEIRHFTSGITWTADYVGIANQEETALRLTGYVRVFNNSGELYDNAQTRLVVGTINLVEKIADLGTSRPVSGSSISINAASCAVIGLLVWLLGARFGPTGAAAGYGFGNLRRNFIEGQNIGIGVLDGSVEGTEPAAVDAHVGVVDVAIDDVGDLTGIGLAVAHPPAASADCSSCHNPHAARDAGLLLDRPAILCVECHTDQATLQALAVEPVAEEILSEGEG